MPVALYVSCLSAGMFTTSEIFFFFQAEDGIRDFHVTGVQTCALPICWRPRPGAVVEGIRLGRLQAERLEPRRKRDLAAPHPGGGVADHGDPLTHRLKGERGGVGARNLV